uniref:Ground-like domain-containing protein n=1 Tax=Parastrongyloides trichosuri TaxID=131310 RepID=A0A0N4ZSX7_PARTI
MTNAFKLSIMVIILLLSDFMYSHKIFKKDVSTEGTTIETPKCNSETLKDYMTRNINHSPSESKRAIQRAAEAGIGGTFSVICSKENFSYLVVTRLYCETQVKEVTCFAFIHE